MVTIANQRNQNFIDFNALQEPSPINFQDDYNNYAFSIRKRKSTTFVYPAVKNDSLVELKVGVLLPFHQNGNNKTKIMTMR